MGFGMYLIRNWESTYIATIQAWTYSFKKNPQNQYRECNLEILTINLTVNYSSELTRNFFMFQLCFT